MLSTGSVEDRSRDAREFGLESILAAVPGAAVAVFDLDAGVLFAAGDTSSCWGFDSALSCGRRLSDVLAHDAWAELRGPCEAALAGRSSVFDFCSPESVYSIRVSPRLSGSEVVGAIAVAQDVTDHRRLESLVSAQDVVARDADRWFAMSTDMLATASLDGYFTRLNPSWERCLGCTEQELMSQPYIKRVHPDDLQSTLAVAGSLADGPSEIVSFENRYQGKDGEWRWLLWSARSDDTTVYVVAKDVTERKKAERALRTSSARLRSILDNTPGALSVKGRDYRYQLVNREFERSLGLEPDWIVGRRSEEILPPLPSGVVELDRQSDDLVLRGEVVEQEAVVQEDGSDRVHLMVKFPLREEDGDIYAVCAIVTDVTDRKRRDEEAQDRLEWTARLADAVDLDLLVLHGQPIVNLATGEVEQAELLLRMRDRDDPSILLMPDAFLPAAERFDLIGAIDLWVVTEALDLAKQGHRVEINLSGKTISNADQVAAIERLVLDSGTAPQNITFEITETAAAEDLGAARHFAQRLRGLGCSFALDDFGVGFGAFTYLKHLRVDFLKIDVEFVRDLVNNEADRQVVRTIAGVAHDFGMKTIAEGVEDQATFDLLRRMGVDYGQGYWIGPPKALDELCTSGGAFAESDGAPSPPQWPRPDHAEVIGTSRPPTIHLVQPARIPSPLRSADVADGEFARRLEDALRHGDGKAAEAVADEALQSGLDVPAIHARLIAPAMDGIGALWAKNLITVGEEHLATAISHGVAARIFPSALQAAPRSREQVMLAAVQGEHHTLGLRLAADVLEGAGYDVLFLGADVPLSALLEACRIHEPAVLGLSVSMWLNVPTLIWELEALAELTYPPAIMIGGRAVSPTLEEGLRAPVIIDSEQVLDVVAGLIASPRRRDFVDPGLASRIPARAPAAAVPTEAKETIQAGFSATSLAAADAVRESARHAFGLEQLAYRDGLTGLYNRRAFDDRFLEMSTQTPDESVMLMIDVDKFKSINDEFGHETGDEVLVDVARTILQMIRPGDFAARFGGDEFVALLADIAAPEGAAIAERIRTAVAAIASSRPPVTLSIGVAAFSATNRLTSQSADRALYRAKESGRNRVSVSEGLD